MIIKFNDKTPNIDKTAFIADTSTVIGDVIISKNASVWFGAVIRGDEDNITIGEASNIQDNATLHCDINKPLVIGKNVTIGHNAIIHSCEIGDNVVIGMGAVILNDAKIGEGSIIGAGSVVKVGSIIPPKSLAVGAPAIIKKELDDKTVEKNIENANEYIRLSLKYKK